MGREDEPPGHRGGDLRAVIAPHEVQPQIERGRTPRRGQYVTLVDEQHVRLQEHLRMQRTELLGPPPVRRGPPLVEQPGLGERERPGAEGGDPGTARVRPPDGLQDGPGARHDVVGAPRHDQGVGAVDGLEPRRPRHREEPVVHPDVGLRRAQRQRVQRAPCTEFGPRQPNTSVATPTSKGLTPSSTRTTTCGTRCEDPCAMRDF